MGNQTVIQAANSQGFINQPQGPVTQNFNYVGPGYARLNYRTEIDDLLKFYTRIFVGRHGILSQIAAFAAQTEPGYLLVKAPAGYGKSALTAWLIQQHISRQWPSTPAPALLYFFVRQEGGRNTPAKFLRAVNSQMLDLLHGEGGAPNDLDSLQGQFTALWTQAVGQASADRPLLLLVDGLDESAGGTETVATTLPSFLYDFVHVVVTARPNPEPLNMVGNEHPFHRAAIQYLNAFDVAEIKALLLANGMASEQAALLATRVREVTRGEPLFARFIAEDVAKNGEQALGELEKYPPRGVEDYFRAEFRHLAQLADTEATEATWDILRLLTIARGSIAQDEIAGVLKMPSNRLRRALQPIRRFLLGEQAFELMHMQFRRVLEDEFTQDELKSRLDGLLVWCRGYQETGWSKATPNYILQNYAGHLADINDPSAEAALAGLFADDRWMRARVENSNHTYDGFVADLNLYWRHCRERGLRDIDQDSTAALATCVRCILLYTNVNSLSANYPGALVLRAVETGAWTVERALSLTARVPDLQRKAGLCVQLLSLADLTSDQRSRLQQWGLAAAQAISEEGERAQAIAAFAPHLDGVQREQALALGLAAVHARGWYRWNRAEVLAALADNLSGELLTQGLASIQAISDEPARAEWLTALAPRLDDVQREQALAQELAAAQAIGDKLARAKVLAALAPHLSGAQREQAFAQGLAAAQAIEHGWDSVQSEALAALAPHLSGELLVQGVVAAKAIGDHSPRAKALAALAPRLSGAQRQDVLAEGIAAVQAELHGWSRGEALAALAPHLSGELLAQGLATAQAGTHHAARACALAALAPRLSDVQREQALTQGLAAAQAELYGGNRDLALAALAPHLSGELLAQGLAAAQAIGDEVPLAHALATLAPHLSGELLVHGLTRGLTTAQAIFNGWNRAEALAAFAPYLSGELLAQGLEAAQAISDESSRARALAALAPRLSDAQREQALAQVLAAILDDKDEFLRALALTALAPGLSGELLVQGLAAVLAISDGGSRGRALAALAPGLSGELVVQGLAAAQVIGDAKGRAKALAALAPRLSGTEQQQVLAQVLTAAQADYDEWTRAQALAALAPHLTGELLAQGLAVAQNISDGRNRAEAVTAFMPYLGGALLARGLAAVQEIGDAADRARALAALALRLSGAQQQQALTQGLEAALAIGDGWDRARALADFVAPLSALQQRQALQEIRRAIVNHLDALRDSERWKVLRLFSRPSLFTPPFLDTPTLALIAGHILEICWKWRWL
jgi:hypothetical protein